MSDQLVLGVDPDLDPVEEARRELALRPWRLQLPAAALHPAYPSPSWLPGIFEGQAALYCQKVVGRDDEGQPVLCDGVIPPLEVFQRVHKAAHLGEQAAAVRPVRPPFKARRRAS